MKLLYIPLMDGSEGFEERILSIKDVIRGLDDEEQTFKIVGTLLAFHHKKLSDNVSSILLEVLLMGGATFEKFKKEVVDSAYKEGERNKAVQMAEKMLRKKMSVDTVIEMTELPSTVIKEMNRKINRH